MYITRLGDSTPETRAEVWKAKWEKVLAAQCVPLQAISQNKAEDKSTSSSLENQGIQVATNQLGNVLGGLNSGRGSGTSSQTSGTTSQDEDINQILDDTFGESESATDKTTLSDEDANQILDDTFADANDASETATTNADTSSTTTTTNDDDINQILDDTFGASEGDQATTTSTNGDQTTTTTDDDVNQALDDAFGTAANDKTATTNTEGDKTIATAIDNDQVTSSPENTFPAESTAENINTGLSSVPSEDAINSALGETFDENNIAESSGGSGGGEIATGSGDSFDDLG